MKSDNETVEIVSVDENTGMVTVRGWAQGGVELECEDCKRAKEARDKKRGDKFRLHAVNFPTRFYQSDK